MMMSVVEQMGEKIHLKLAAVRSVVRIGYWQAFSVRSHRIDNTKGNARFLRLTKNVEPFERILF